MGVTTIRARLDRELTPLGFRRDKVTWNRGEGDWIDVVDVQASEAGSEATINAGVLCQPVYVALWGQAPGPFVQEPECTVRARVGRLIDGCDRWWATADGGVAEEMAACLTAHVLPWLRSMGSLEAMRNWLASEGAPSKRRPMETVNDAIIQARLGDTAAAREILESLERDALGGWKSRAVEVARRIGCLR